MYLLHRQAVIFKLSFAITSAPRNPAQKQMTPKAESAAQATTHASCG
jgi:hypothetical protein